VSTRSVLVQRLFMLFMLGSLAVGFVTLGVLLVDIFSTGWAYVDEALFANATSSNPNRAGARPAILGTIEIMLLLLVMAVPVGVAAALYLEEYADRTGRFARILELNIQNLAAVPSIVFGILGLAFIVRGPLGIGRVLIAGALTLTLLVLPTVIIAAREAIRAVPDSMRQGSLALGATKWQTIWRQVLPAAIPGIATGSILALSRAIGETAPLIMIGALAFITTNPTPGSQFTALPIQIFNWTKESRDEFQSLAAAAIIVLLGLLLVLNLAAILIRNRYQKRW
jgi:phosphate transport system permease protein